MLRRKVLKYRVLGFPLKRQRDSSVKAMRFKRKGNAIQA